jgi:hypothetical protein
MPVAVPELIVEAFAINGDKNLIPVPSQISTSPGLASFNDGFPPATRTPRTSGGIPPLGVDMNGILNMISSYCAFWQGGGFPTYSVDFVTTNTGYGVGARLQSVSNPNVFYINQLADNAADPDVDTTGWLMSPAVGGATGVQTETLAAGVTAAVALDSNIGFLDITSNAAGSTLQSITGGFDGQVITVTEVSATGALTLAKLAGTAGSQLRLPTDLTFLQYSGQSFKYSSSLSIWVPI